MVRIRRAGRCAVGHGCRAVALLPSSFVTNRIVSMRTRRLPRTALTAAAPLFAVGFAFRCFAGTLDIKVSDERGEPVSQVAVYATPLTPAKKTGAPVRTAS